MPSIEAFNGSDVFIRVKDINTGKWSIVGGQLAHSETMTNQPIDITCKQNGGVRDIMAANGLQMLDMSMEIQFSSDSAFDYIKSSQESQDIELFQVIRGASIGTANDNIDEFHAKVTTFAESSPDNDKVTASITLMSSNEFELGLTFESFQDSALQQFLTSDGTPFFVRTP